jgi:hypothetical protein
MLHAIWRLKAKASWSACLIPTSPHDVNTQRSSGDAAMRAYLILVMTLLSTIGWAADMTPPLSPTVNEAVPAVAPSINRGQRIYVCAHSFHMGITQPLVELSEAAGLSGCTSACRALPAARTIKHWEEPEASNPVKQVLVSGAVDVLTLSPMRQHPDEGIDLFVDLGLAHNADMRFTVQQSWFARDEPDPPAKKLSREQRLALTRDDLFRMHEAYFHEFEAQIDAINKRIGRTVVFTVPVSRALFELRERARKGEIPGIDNQLALFTDTIGHPGALVTALNTYCHWSVIYRRCPYGLPPLQCVGPSDDPQTLVIDRLVKEIAWSAVSSHPQTGIVIDSPTRSTAKRTTR